MGSGSLLFKLESKSIINDINEPLINTYRSIKDNPKKLIGELKKFEDMNNENDYNEIRDVFNSNEFMRKSLEERAATFIYLINTSFGSKYRINSKGEFNNTYWKKENNKFLPDYDDILIVSEFLKKEVEIMHGDFACSLKNCDKDDFIYFDPPYYKREGLYDIQKFTYQDQVRIRDIVKCLNDKKCKFMITNIDCKEIRELFSSFKIYELSSKCKLDSKSENKDKNISKYKEILIKNY